MNLAKTYDPNQFEPNIYALWEASGAFNPTGKGEPYSIVMPPPNANGNLHLGHALTFPLEDILVRYHRMKGRDAILIPGADHAGFETWVVYEKELAKQGKSRFDYSRDELYKQVWDFVASNRTTMDLQLRALGVGASWDNLVFTLDQKVVDTAYATFKQLWDDKLIYRGERIVSYCTVHQTGFSDYEVEYEEEQGKLWRIAYPVMDKIGELIVATTRPETLFGDVAVAVHPDDERYKQFIGSKVQLPLTDREIPVIADEYVDTSFGTGVLKITPAHDPNDFEVGERHKLPRLSVIDFNGKMVNVPPAYKNMTADEARTRVLENLKLASLLRGEETMTHSVGHCYKCKSVIQPLLKDQWFLNMKPLAERAIKVLNDGDITFVPQSKGKALIQYMENIRDWNLSRQIPWGIPIPAFQNINDPDDWIFDTSVDKEEIVVNDTTYRRDPDTFDTWFSSGQWPFITTDFLTNGEFSRFFPLNVMETAGEILYVWVGRMIMLSLYATDSVPFKDVYLHGLVLDEHGQKMSKSKGNVINPMELISEYGSDALRLGIVAARSAAQNQAFSVSKVVAGRNFCNKLWNIARFIEGRLGEDFALEAPEPQTLADHWIVRQLNDAAKTIGEQVEKYRFAEASEAVYHTIWDDVADWYIEASKRQDNPQLLAWVLDTSLRIAHPFAPFVTETIWQTLGWNKELLVVAAWPEVLEFDEISAGQFERLRSLVAETRYVTAALPGNEKYTLLYQNDSLIADNVALIAHLARVKAVEPVEQARGLRLAASGREAWLDVDAETLYEHQTNLEVRLAEARQFVATLEGRLSNTTYVEKAPAHLVEESKRQLEEKKKLVEQLANELEVLN